MKVKGSDLSRILSTIQKMASSYIDSNNLIMISEGGKVKLLASSRNATVQLKETIEIDESDPFYDAEPIGLALKPLFQCISEAGEDEIILGLNEESTGYVMVKTRRDKYNIAYQRIPRDSVTALSTEIPGNVTTLIEDTKIEELIPISDMISNIGSLCPDGKFKSIMYKTDGKLNIVFITASIISTFNIPSSSESDIVGIDTKTPSVPVSLSKVISASDKKDTMSLKFDDNNVYIDTNVVSVKLTYIRGQKEVSESAAGINRTVNGILEMDRNHIKIKVHPGMLLSCVQKASIFVNKSSHEKLAAYIPLKMENRHSIGVDYRNASGSFSTIIDERVDIEGGSREVSKDDPYELPISMPMLISMLDTLKKACANERVSIEARKSDEGIVFVRVCPEERNNINYFLRLRVRT